MYRTGTSGDVEMRVSYYFTGDAQNANHRLLIEPRFESGNDYVIAEVKPDRMLLYQKDGGTFTTFDTNTSADTELNTWYDVRVVMDGPEAKVYRAKRGELEAEVLSATGITQTAGNQSRVRVHTGGVYRIDDVLIVKDGLSRTTTFGVNNANELTSVADYNGVTNIAYDAWGRTASKTRGSDSITYEWAKGNFLTEVDATNWGPIGKTVEYGYRGDGRRLSRVVDGLYATNYSYAGWTVTNEATYIGFGGGLSKTYVPGLAEIPGNSPTTDDYHYYTHDHLGSTRGLYDPSKNLLGDYEFTPFGESYHFQTAEDVTMLFTGHQYDAVTGDYFAPFRFLDPSAGRWMKQDPLGFVNGPNMYGYVGGNPIVYTDPLGLFGSDDDDDDWHESLLDFQWYTRMAKDMLQYFLYDYYKPLPEIPVPDLPLVEAYGRGSFGPGWLGFNAGSDGSFQWACGLQLPPSSGSAGGGISIPNVFEPRDRGPLSPDSLSIFLWRGIRLRIGFDDGSVGLGYSTSQTPVTFRWNLQFSDDDD